jgi:release factor glutamine methyltransferase
LILHDRLAAARKQLVRAGIQSGEAAVDVDLYVRTILGWERPDLLTRLPEPAPDDLEPRLSEWIARRARGEPSAYIVGRREFWGLDFHVTPAVLIPRPETEFIVEEALKVIRPGPGCRVADIGTGSGCIVVSLAREIPECSMTATDVSAEALEVARDNARRHGVADRITFVQTSYLDGIAGKFDAIVANPPYVRQGDKPALARDVKHEPDVALFGGTTGLRDIDGAMEAAVNGLKPGGWFVMEFGFGQEDEVRALLELRPLRLDHVHEDLQGIPRTAIIQRA